MCQWIDEARRSASLDMTAKSFKVTGLCNDVGNEDDFLWYQSDEESSQENATDNDEG
jgi:hypothetical protein